MAKKKGELQEGLEYISAGYFKEHELIFNGTPLEFRKIAEWYAERHKRTDPNAYDLWYLYSYREDIDTGYISFKHRYDFTREWAEVITSNGYAEAIPAPGGKARIQVYTQMVGEWVTLQDVWKPFEAELRRQGWVDDATDSPTGGDNQPAPPFKGGRPRLPENEWAYEQVRELGREPNDVYPEWLDRIGTRADILDNPRDSFSKAIKQKKRK